MAHILLQTLPITAYSGSIPLEKNQLKFLKNLLASNPLELNNSTYVKPLDNVSAACDMGFAPASAI